MALTQRTPDLLCRHIACSVAAWLKPSIPKSTRKPSLSQPFSPCSPYSHLAMAAASQHSSLYCILGPILGLALLCPCGGSIGDTILEKHSQVGDPRLETAAAGAALFRVTAAETLSSRPPTKCARELLYDKLLREPTTSHARLCHDR